MVQSTITDMLATVSEAGEELLDWGELVCFLPKWPYMEYSYRSLETFSRRHSGSKRCARPTLPPVFDGYPIKSREFDSSRDDPGQST